MRLKESRRNIKRIASLCICAAIAIAFAGCGGKVKISEDMTPSQTPAAFLDSFKAQEWDNMEKIYAGKSEDFTKAYQTPEGDDEASNALHEAFMTKLYDFDYEIGQEKISEDGKTSTVEITTKTYDMKKVFDDFYEEYMGKALDVYTGKSSQMKDEDLEKMAEETLQEQIDQATEKTYEGKAVLNLTQTDGRWVVDKIDEGNHEFLNAVSGGMMDVTADVITTQEEQKGAGAGEDDADQE